MAIVCPDCGRQYDVTLFQFGQTVECECGAVIEYGEDVSHGRPDPETEALDPVEIPIDGALDLHAFLPAEVKELVPEYLDACREKNILRVRIIHGKGTGEMMKTVQALLGRLSDVVSFELAGPHEGGSGATIVHLKK